MAQILFPPGTPNLGDTFDAPNGFRYEYVAPGVWITIDVPPPLVITYAGSIVGTPEAGSTLTYILGSWEGGVGPYTYTFEWKKESDGSIVGTTDDFTFLIPNSLVGDRVYVTLTVTDSLGTTVSADTDPYPAPPDVITAPGVVITDPGYIIGTPELGATLTYVLGAWTGGVPPYTPTWEWKRESDGLVVGVTDSPTLVVPASLLGDRVYVQLTVTDSLGSSDTADTNPYPPAPDVIVKPKFDIKINFPTQLYQIAPTAWTIPGTTLFSNDCIEISVDGTNFGASYVINTGDTLYTRWKISPLCGDLPSGTIYGCVFDTTHEECGSLTINRVPTNFPPFTPVTGITPGFYGTSNAVVPTGNNSPAYLTYASLPAGVSAVEASVDGGLTWNAVPATGDTFQVPVSASLTVRYKGALPLTSYQVTFRLGNGTTFLSQPFDLTTGPAAFPLTVFSPSYAPNAIPDVVSIGAPENLAGTASGTWADGSVNIYATGCLEYKIGAGGSWGQASQLVGNGQTVFLRWKYDTSCGDQATGTQISGTLTDGLYANNYQMTLDRVPGPYSFGNQLNKPLSTATQSNIITPDLYNDYTEILLTGGTLTSVKASVGGGAFTAIPSASPGLLIYPGQTLQIEGVTGGTLDTDYTASITVGGTPTTWTVRTTAGSPAVATPTIISPAPAVPVNPSINSPSGVLLTGSTYSSSGGAGPHASSDWQVYSINWKTSTVSSAVVSTPPATSGFSPCFGDAINIGSYSAFYSGPATLTVNWAVTGGGPAATSGFLAYSTGAQFYSWTAGSPASGGSDSTNLNFGPASGGSLGWGSFGVTQPAEPCFTSWSLTGFSGAGLVAYNTLTFSSSQGLSYFSVGNTVTSSDGSATGTITSLSGTTMVLQPYTGSWAGKTINLPGSPQVPTTDPPTAGIYTAVTSVTNSTTDLETFTVPKSLLTPSTYYCAKVRYTSATIPTTSAWSAWSIFQTASSFVLPIGTPMFGGYFGGYISTTGSGTATHKLIVSPRADGQYPGSGAGGFPSIVNYKTSATPDFPSATYQNLVYGSGATTAGADALHPLLIWADNLTIAGYSDWYVPAKNELEIIYRNMKPNGTANNTSSGTNPNAVPATGNYTGGSPGTTSAAAFAGAGSEAFDPTTPYWTSSENVGSPGAAWSQSFADGLQSSSFKINNLFARVIRRVVD